MSNVKTESTTRFNYNNDNAFSDVSRNFKPSEMALEETANGSVYRHKSGVSVMKTEDGMFNAYDSSNKLVGKFKTQDEVASALERNFYKEQVESDKNRVAGQKIQQKHQGSFKVIDDATRAEAKRTGSIFTTAWGKEFVGSTKLIPQTREEFFLSNMVKLRQAKPEVIRKMFEAKAQEIEGMRARAGEIKKLYAQCLLRTDIETVCFYCHLLFRLNFNIKGILSQAGCLLPCILSLHLINSILYLSQYFLFI
jgi:hypothetical protein